MKKEYFPELDSLRGFAAMQVLFGHCLLAVPGWEFFKTTDKPTQTIEYFINSPLHFFWSDTQAVILFFVLSGFVLALPYYSERKSRPNYFPFFFKRLFRLYLPCLSILIISLVLRSFFYNPEIIIEAGGSVKKMWSYPINKELLINIILLQPSYLDHVDGPLWSLNPEIKLSLILPFFSIFWIKLTKIKSIGFLFLYVFIYHSLVKLNVQSIIPEFVTMYYLTYFLIGVILCKYRDKLMSLANSTGNFLTILLLFLAVYLYTFQFSSWWLYQPLYNIGNKISDQLASIGGSIILIFAISDKFKWLFNHKVSTYLGKLSFSIYLVHTIIITTLFYILTPHFKPWQIVSISFVLIFPFSWIFYTSVERPSALFSKKIYIFINNKFVKP
jgi:peptidoglycan/LPS O-acetylase OafA/YrhL